MALEPQNPQDIFQSYLKMGNEMMESFAAAQGQEMYTEFNKAWNAWRTQALENPTEWIDLMTQYQRQQAGLWMKMFNLPNAEQFQEFTKPAPTDRRFHDKDWNDNPVFDFLKQSYLVASNLLTQMADNAELDEENQKKLKFYTRYFIDAMSPTNFAATNPEVIRQALESNGQSLLDGLQNLMGDMQKGRISMTDESAFEVGKNLATTEGAVVFENELMQVIQYKPTTEKVSDIPLLIVPPCINKFYILDLQEKNSFVKYCVDQGNTVFLISWVNADADQAHISWDNYIDDGVIKALEVVKSITAAKKINTVAWCVGGTILATALAVLHARRKQSLVNSATYFTALLDFSDPGEIGVFIDDMQVAQREAMLKHSGILSGRDLATAFSMLRANDLIWSYVVNNYLKGQTPAPFDILYWNSDPTNLPAQMYSYYLRNMYMDNKLSKPNELTLCDVSIDLGKIKTPTYFLSTIDDHIAPWKTTFTGTELLSGNTEFVLGASGHIAGVINPANKNKRNYWVNGELGKGADKWLETAKSEPGSWWPHWINWLKGQGGAEADAITTYGNKDYPVVEPAPGRYVVKRID